MAEPGRDLDLALEALGADVGGEMRMQDLDGDGAVVLEVVGEEDGRHAAAADFTLDAVAVGEGFLQPGLIARGRLLGGHE